MVNDPAISRQRLLRLTRRICIAALLCFGSYAVATNAFLLVHGTALLFKSTNTVDATYRDAYSILPGVVHVHDLRIVFQDKNVQWSLDIERATVRIALIDLLRRRFHVRWLRGNGVAFRFRHRIAPESRNESWVSTLPSIPEFASPAVFEATVPEPPIPDDQYKLWTVHIENVDVGVRELWFQFVRYCGSARVRGSFRLVPARTLWVGPALLDLEHGQATFGNVVLAHRVAGRIDCRVDLFDVRVPQGREVLRYINTDISLRTPDFRVDPFIQFFEQPDVAVGTATGALAVDIHVRRGRLIPTTKVEYTAGATHLSAKGIHLDVPAAHAAFEMIGTNGANLECQVDHGDVDSSATLENAVLRAAIEGSDLASELSVRSSSLTIGRLDIRDARAFSGLLDAHHLPVITHGELEATLAVSQTPEETRARLSARLFDVRLKRAEQYLSATGVLDAQLHAQTARKLTFDASAHATLDNATIQLPAQHIRGTLRHVALDATYGQESSGRNLQFHTRAASLSAVTEDRRWLGEQFRVSGNFTDHHGHAQGNLEVALRSLGLTSHDSRLTFRPSARVTLHQYDRRRNEGKLSASLDLSVWNTSYGDDGGQCSTLAAPDTHLHITTRLGQGAVNSRLEGHAKHVQVNWGKNFAAHTDMQITSELTTTTSRELAKHGFGSLSIRLVNPKFVSDGGAPQGWDVASPEILLQANAALGPQLAATLSASTKRATGHIGGVSIETSLDAEVPDLRLDWSERTVLFGAKVRIRNSNLMTNEQQIVNWWADVDTTSTRFVARDNLDIFAVFHASMRDATPGLMLIDKTRHLPSWLANALPLQGVTTAGMLSRRCRLTAIRFDRVSGGPLTASGTLQSAGDVLRGAFLVRLKAASPLSAGVEVGPPDAGISPLVGDDWLREHTSRLDNAAEQILSAPCRVETQRCAASK